MKNNQALDSRRVKAGGMVLVGAGLLILGVLAGILLLTNEANANRSQPDNETAQLPSVVPAQVNFPAPDLSLSDVEGNPVSLADYRGQVVLVNNWATWCPPCKAEMPALQAYYEDHQDQGFVLVAIEAGEPADEVAQFASDYGLTFPVWLDPDSAALEAFNNFTLPSSYVIDAQGTVRLAWSGAISREMLETYLTPLLEE